jgi:rhodanese-related sulfurtransferase/DNA-binding transcriptional ArsR family regulator
LNQNPNLLKKDLFEQFSQIGKALGNGARLELLDLLSQSERRVDELAELTGHSVANVSQHLQVLRRAQLVEVRRHGTQRFYQLRNGNVFAIWQAIRTFGEENLAEINRLVSTYFDAPDRLEPVSAEELQERIEAGDVVVLDVRPEKEFRAAHIPGAVSIPIVELKRRLRELPRRREIIAYCRGPYCVYAKDAVRELSKNGYRARRLSIGLPDWRALGFPVASAKGFA